MYYTYISRLRRGHPPMKYIKIEQFSRHLAVNLRISSTEETHQPARMGISSKKIGYDDSQQERGFYTLGNKHGDSTNKHCI